MASRNNTHQLLMSSSQSSPTAQNESVNLSFVKGGKRKRLSKACDACHKSKRRCDGTAPCSNCYFASKECTYTDSTGRPVPAPRNNHPQLTGEHLAHEVNSSQNADSGAQIKNALHGRSNSFSGSSTSRIVRRDPAVDSSTKRIRPESIVVIPSFTEPQSPLSAEPRKGSPNALLDLSTTHELVNLFFTHSNPNRVIIHKPSFSAALAHDEVPSYLLLAVCANAAPLSKDLGSKTSPPRLAGVPFFQEAVRLMFDNSGRLLVQPSLSAAQALCLLEMHEVAASHSWTRHYRYFDLALQMLEDSLGISKPDPASYSPPLSPGSRTMCIERECTLRCFWLIQCMGWINGIYTYRPMRPRSVELMRHVRLPCDETSFEWVVPVQQPEYLHVPAPRTKYASQFGHLCRILSMYRTLETALASKEGPERVHAVAELGKALDIWVSSLPDHLRFSEETLEKQISMFETSSNTGAWCFCFMHVLHPCFVLSLIEGQGKQSEPVEWIRNQLNIIFAATGSRAKNTILSACALWSYSKYHPDDPLLQKWDDDFEKVWGFRVAVVADQWRKVQAQQRTQIGRSYPVDSVSTGDTPPAFASAVSDTSPSPSTTESPHEPEPQQQYYATEDQRTVFVAEPNDFSAQGYPSEGIPSSDPTILAQGSRRDSLSLPSLKSSGLLDSWKPPTDAFAQSLSISPRVNIPRQEDQQRVIHGPGVHVSGQVSGHGRNGASMPVGLNWLNNES